MRDIDWDDPALAVLGALDRGRTAQGLSPSRLPAWSHAQMPDPALALVAAMTSGVRLSFRTDADRIELDLQETGVQIEGAPRMAANLDLFVDGELASRRPLDRGPTLVIDLAARPPGIRFEAGAPSTVSFDGLAPGPKEIEIWLPQSASTQLKALRLPAGASLAPRTSHAAQWAHYGSSISHGMEAAGPSETWPAVAAGRGGVELTSLGFAGQCHLDGLVARCLRDLEADFISLKLGINVVNLDSMRERAFVPAAHTFLDIIRERRPATPIIVISPIICPVAEDHPGPTGSDGASIRVFDRPAELQPGALSLRRIREILAGIVERRRSAGDLQLHYLDGLELFGAADVADLPDGLHPNANGLKRIGERFARLAFALDGPFAAAQLAKRVRAKRSR
jgi:hypothetical protein